MRYVDPTGHAGIAVAARKERERRQASTTSGVTYSTDQAGNVVIADPAGRVNRPRPETTTEQQARWDKSAAFRPYQASTEATTVTEDAGLESTGDPAIDTELKRRRDSIAAMRRVGEVGIAVGETALEAGAGDAGDLTAAATGTTVTGRKLTSKQRAVAAALVVVPIIAMSHIKAAEKIVDAADDAAGEAKKVKVSKSAYPDEYELAQASGMPTGPFTKVDKATRDANRRENLRSIPSVPKKDRGEWPPAMTREGRDATVKHIDPSQNRGSGASMGNQTRDLRPGEKFVVDWDE